jgi:hypothetical protein
MENVISLQGRKAEERLAKMHQIKRSAGESAKMFMDAMRANDPDYCMSFGNAKLIPMSFGDIGMSSEEELIQAFASLDAAIAAFNLDDIEHHLARLLGEQQLHIKLV